jgi:hypothetical protein
MLLTAHTRSSGHPDEKVRPLWVDSGPATLSHDLLRLYPHQYQPDLAGGELTAL